MPTGLFSLADRVAIVTGSARGLGQALATGLADQGAKVVLCDLNEEGARQAAERIASTGGQAAATAVDVADPESCDALVRFAVEQFGRVDILVNNAGIDVIEPVPDVSPEGWEKVMDVNLRGVMNASQSAIRQMLAQGEGGSIVNISSIAAIVGIPGLASYSAAKSGVNLLTKVMAVELAPKGIRVNSIAPGYLENIMGGAAAEHAKPETEGRIRARTPLGRRARLSELVGPVVFLASDAASYVTGTVLMVDGGYTAA
ncbi:MAG TPA: SDR family oxidoreductase [Thermoanaerobaculia bacterium]|nr:SDR family oxidoreductase [Thermoanaerobaculia bacterium]